MSNINVLADRWEKDDRAPPGAIGGSPRKSDTYIPAFEIMKQLHDENEKNMILPQASNSTKLFG